MYNCVLVKSLQCIKVVKIKVMQSQFSLSAVVVDSGSPPAGVREPWPWEFTGRFPGALG